MVHVKLLDIYAKPREMGYAHPSQPKADTTSGKYIMPSLFSLSKMYWEIMFAIYFYIVQQW